MGHRGLGQQASPAGRFCRGVSRISSRPPYSRGLYRLSGTVPWRAVPWPWRRGPWPWPFGGTDEVMDLGGGGAGRGGGGGDSPCLREAAGNCGNLPANGAGDAANSIHVQHPPSLHHPTPASPTFAPHCRRHLRRQKTGFDLSPVPSRRGVFDEVSPSFSPGPGPAQARIARAPCRALPLTRLTSRRHAPLRAPRRATPSFALVLVCRGTTAPALRERGEGKFARV